MTQITLSPRFKLRRASSSGFTLVEVVLSIGVLGLAVLALIGMFAPTMEAVRQVKETNAAVNLTTKMANWIEEADFDDVWTMTTTFEPADPDPSSAAEEASVLFAYTTLPDPASELLQDVIISTYDKNPDGSQKYSDLEQVIMDNAMTSSGGATDPAMDILEGPIFMVRLSKSLNQPDVNGDTNKGSDGTPFSVGGYSGSVDDYAYFAITVDIYSVTPGNLYSTASKVFSYTTIKNR